MTALLVFDCETTGLTKDDTILEVAWTICALNGEQRLPLRSRFAEITSSMGYTVLPLKRSDTNFPVWADDRPFRRDETAMRMAETSGLYDAWLRCPPGQRLLNGDQLERLLLDDLADATTPGEKVHVAGCGVAQFDHPLLREHCPGVVPVQGETGPTHYRTVDVSVTQTALLGNNAEEAVIAWFIREFGAERARIELASGPQYAYGDDVPSAWLSGLRGQHRAAPDVARAIIIQRALWEYGALLRRALVDTGIAKKVSAGSGH